jgi:hypothetical protein
MEFSARPGRFAAGAHKLTLENRHLTGASVYLFNAAQPASGSIRISKQIRDENQSAGGIEFVFQRPQNSSRAMIGLIALLLVLVVSVSAGAQRKREGARLALAKRGDF